MIITAKLDVTKIDKARLFAGKNGAKYLDVVLISKRDGPDQYGNDFMVVQEVSRAERDRGVKGAILGNGKILDRGGERQSPASNHAQAADEPESDDVPF